MDFRPVSKWLEHAGEFDEESCRYFLHEVGQKIVPCFPFFAGIEEVYGLIIQKYGLEQSADVTSILQELLEDEQNACGLGDDGDIWRSWRHSWRHRNDDISNPFVPRIGNLILRPTTEAKLRRLKADNFLRQQKFQHHGAIEESQVATPTHYSSADVAISEYLDVDPALMRSFELCESFRQLDTPRPERNIPVKRLSPVREEISTPNPLDRSLVLPKRWSTYPQMQAGPMLHTTPPMHVSPVENISKVISDSNDKATSCSYHCMTESEQESQCGKRSIDKSSNEARCNISHAARPVSQETDGRENANMVTESERAAHRHARLIDGTMFMLRTRRSKILGWTQKDIDSSLPPVAVPISAAPDQSPAKHIVRLGNNCLRSLRQILFSRISRSSSLVSARQHLKMTPANHDPAPFASKMSLRGRANPKSISDDNAGPVFDLNGASDSSSSPSRSFLDINKPLPRSPEFLCQPESRHVTNDSRPSLTTSEHFSPTASSTSSKLSSKSSRAEFRTATRAILQASALDVQELPSISESDPVVGLGQSDSRQLETPPVSWKTMSVARSNANTPTPSTPGFPPPLEVKRLHDTQAEYHRQAFPTSQSLPVLQRSPRTQMTDQSLPTETQAAGERLSITSVDSKLCGFRGRASSVKASTPTTSHASTTTPHRSSKRSQSPFKRLLALGRNGETASAKNNRDTEARDTQTSSKQSSIKKWGTRIRHGFLTPDEEQLKQEEMAEKYLHGNTPSPRNSTFPVSLEPPTQAKLQSEIELYITVTANRYLLKEARAGRLTTESVAKFRDRWAKLGRPQVVEFHYDQMYQHDLIFANLTTVKLCGDAAKDPTQVQSTLNGWRVMAREMSIRTFCSPDSVLRKHLHDAHRVLELLGAPLVTFLAYESMQIKSLQMITQRQKERIDRKRVNGHMRSYSDGTRLPSSSDTQYETEYTAEAFQLDRIKLSPSPAPRYRGSPRKVTGAEGAIMSLPIPPSRMVAMPAKKFQNCTDTLDYSRGGRLGKAIRGKPEDLLL